MNKYERLKVVGRGAFGTVYLCRSHQDGGREVIIKQIPMEQMNKLDRAATINEVKVLAMLHHPNIIEYYENFVQDNAMMIVMEYAAGGTLYDYLEEQATTGAYLDEDEIAHLFAQIVLPTHVVHSRQILHRDLKSQNIFLTKNRDHVKIGDFGISKILSSKSKAYTVVGTPCYISPELCEGKAYNQKSDVWALGCILYEMCTFKRAFEAPTLPALVLKIMRGNYHPLPTHYSCSLRDFVSSLLAIDPRDRPDVECIMAHPWLAPHIYKLPTTLGLLPCTAKPPRPLSAMTVPDSSKPSKKSSKTPMFSKRNESTVLLRVVLDSEQHATSARPLRMPTSAGFGGGGAHKSGAEEVLHLSATDASVLAATSAGGVLEWAWASNPPSPRRLEGLSGISVTRVACGGRATFLLTDRGILLTYGRGRDGVLGHGAARDLEQPKIVEALLGDEVTQVSCFEGRACALTSDNELFVWGRNENGSLGWPGRHTVLTPTRVDAVGADAGKIESVSCQQGSIGVITAGGELFMTADLRRESLAQIVYPPSSDARPESTSTFVKLSRNGEEVAGFAVVSSRKKPQDNLLLLLRDGRVLHVRHRNVNAVVLASGMLKLTPAVHSAVLLGTNNQLWIWSAGDAEKTSPAPPLHRLELPRDQMPDVEDKHVKSVALNNDQNLIVLFKAQK